METREIKDKYNTLIKDKLKGDYEYDRWFKNELAKAGYEMTKKSIERQLLNRQELKYGSYFELGPGPGTWTRLFLEKNSSAAYTLVDISREMLKLAQEKLVNYVNVKYFEADFYDFKEEKKYDFFFSSRALEYLPDKEKAVKKIYALLNEDGRGAIITKNPRYYLYKLLNRKVPAMHKGQISPRKLEKIFKRTGLKEIKIYPVIMTVPLLKSEFLNRLAYKVLGNVKFNIISRLLAESYMVKFKK